MSNDLLNKTYWMLPYEARRFLFKINHRDNYLRLIGLRTAESQKLNSPTFKPFIEHRCIFVHIPKSAGISLGYSIFGRHTGNHTTISEYQIAFDRSEFNSFFKFTFVRNPWDRLLSAFLFLKNGGRNKGDLQWAEQHLSDYKSFDEFVTKWVNRDNIYKGIHFIPQHKFITTKNPAKPDVDFMGFFENINDDYEYVRNRLGVGNNLIHDNKTAGRNGEYRSYYNEKIKDIVSDVYREDISLLGYNFDNTSLEKQIKERKAGW